MSADKPAILLVGGSSEIGGAIVQAIALGAGSGACIVLAGRADSEIEAAARQLRAERHSVQRHEYAADWSPRQTRQMILDAEASVGPLDVIVVAVGMMKSTTPDTETHRPVTAVTEPGLLEILQTNLVGPALVANEAVDLLCSRGHGRLIVITSAFAARPRDQILGYAVAKQALDSLVCGLDRRSRACGVRCLVVRPGQVRTRMTAGLPDVLFTTDPEHVGFQVCRAPNRRSGVIWSPPLLRQVSFLLKITPSRILPGRLR